MLIKVIILAPIMYFLAIIQGSFLPHFAIFSYMPNLVFILIIFLIFLVPSVSFVAAISGGIFLDIFSTNFLGFHVLILLGAVFFVEFILRKYVQIAIR